MAIAKLFALDANATKILPENKCNQTMKLDQLI